MKRKISMFNSCKEKTQYALVSLMDWLKGEGPYRTIIDQIRSTTDKSEITRLKLALPAATISGIFSERNLAGLKEHTGLICLDIDGKDNLEMTNMEDIKSITSKLPFIMYCGLSVSARGVFCIVQIAYTEKYLFHFYALEKELQEMGITIDPACKDVTRLRFLSYDDNAYYNQDAEIYTECIDKSVRAYKEKGIKNSSENKQQSHEQVIMEPKELTKMELMEQMMLSVFAKEPFFLSPLANSRQRAIYNLLDFAIAKQVDITRIYNDWILICGIIAANFGEEGRKLFLNVSRFYPNYTETECNNKYDELLTKHYTPSTKTLEAILGSYGL